MWVTDPFVFSIECHADSSVFNSDRRSAHRVGHLLRRVLLPKSQYDAVDLVPSRQATTSIRYQRNGPKRHNATSHGDPAPDDPIDEPGDDAISETYDGHAAANGTDGANGPSGFDGVYGPNGWNEQHDVGASAVSTAHPASTYASAAATTAADNADARPDQPITAEPVSATANRRSTAGAHAFTAHDAYGGTSPASGNLLASATTRFCVLSSPAIHVPLESTRPTPVHGSS
jgi:hypothetical protein